MTTNRKMALAGIITVLIAVVSWLTVLDSDDSDILAGDESLAWFQSGAFEVGVATIPATPRVGESELIVRVRLANGDPANNVEVSAYAEMPAMGSMSAMRAPADLVETTSGQFEGAVDLRMRGAWPLTVSVADAVHGTAEMSFDLATDRAGLRIETGAGQHGVATATVCARFDLPCVVYMGVEDIERQKPNVFRMKLLGAEVVPVTSGSQTLKDAMNEALRDWVANVENTFYIIGTVAGPHPYPAMVRDFQRVIGDEVREQILAAEGRLPDTLVACIGGGSNAMGLFHTFLDEPKIHIIGVEAAGHGLDTDQHAASLTGGRPGVLHGNRTYLLQDDDGQIQEAHSISAGLDYPGIGPEHSWLHEVGRVEYVSATDQEALEAFQLCSQMEGIIPALEPAHALAHVSRIAPELPRDHLLVMNLCGRGDKDVFTVADALGVSL